MQKVLCTPAWVSPYSIIIHLEYVGVSTPVWQHDADQCDIVCSDCHSVQGRTDL